MDTNMKCGANQDDCFCSSCLWCSQGTRIHLISYSYVWLELLSLKKNNQKNTNASPACKSV